MKDDLYPSPELRKQIEAEKSQNKKETEIGTISFIKEVEKVSLIKLQESPKSPVKSSNKNKSPNHTF